MRRVGTEENTKKVMTSRDRRELPATPLRFSMKALKRFLKIKKNKRSRRTRLKLTNPKKKTEYSKGRSLLVRKTRNSNHARIIKSSINPRIEKTSRFLFPNSFGERTMSSYPSSCSLRASISRATNAASLPLLPLAPPARARA